MSANNESGGSSYAEPANTVFLQGIKDGMPIAIGYAPVAITFGVLAGNTGLKAFEALLMSMLVFAGAAQYMALSMIAAGSGVLAVISATFVVNLRHLLMSTAMNERIDKGTRSKRSLAAFLLTDEVFAVSSAKKSPVPLTELIGTGLAAYSSWIGFTLAGYYTGGVIPVFLQESLGIALYALFIALIVPSIQSGGRLVFFLAALGGLFHAAYAQWMDTGWAVMLAAISAVAVMELIEGGIKWRHRS
ncbi:AzlC family ABC transporter permease [Salisediminibacterium halotolerans]|uniref:AzlC family ABC transporter permease n=1 Tax=Salisediminibacterium halotolerans TaxID=517425 RepID=UPI000EB35E11|nr:AzlC family ABC transporter permease [Salisediminibacterium halotolerans]RLJ74463.1 4-azaleucine resistance transporter AzlC [Actinophytocola xinjiangensis]RPE87444.1 4-azaleucine resistance transporter AzlC [Salisediminibacterium halotolerans]TWG35299.1 4-azaleucine resistance transporter AzlC [Salisediminibacterium halotolerans]GEL06781.1 hypothetical protein SHA02_01970 [Salisediminibacterium halotolerans]